MGNIYEVGVGFFKVSFADALNRAGDGDTIILSEGFYYLNDTFELNRNISIVARDSDIGKVVISNTFTLLKGVKVSFKNINFSGDFLTNIFFVANGSQLILENCHLESGDILQEYGDITSATYYPLLFSDNAKINLVQSEVHETVFQSAILGQNQSELNISNSSVSGVQLYSQTSLECFNTDFLTFIQVFGASKINARGKLGIYGNHTWQVLHLVEGSHATIETLFSHHWTELEIGVYESSLDIKEYDFADGCGVKVKHRNSTLNGMIVGLTFLEQVDLNNNPIEDFNNVTPTLEQASISPKNPLGELNQLIGLTSVKEQVQEFIATVELNKRRSQMGLPTQEIVLHSLFLGNPGTGKTTVARLLGDLLFHAGVIRKNKLIEVDRDRLVGTIIGKTEEITLAKLEEARGGILFVDEAYTLNNGSSNDFGKIAVNTIMKFMEDNRDDIMIIFAGYHDEMQNFLGLNPGISSRVPNVFDFEDYSDDEIFSIGKAGLLKLGYQFDEEYYRKAIIKAYRKEVVKSNARFARNFNDAISKALASRVRGENGVDLTRVMNEDIAAVVGGIDEDSDQKIQELLDELNGLVGLAPVKSYVSNLVKKVAVDKRLEEQLGTTIENPTYHMLFTGNPGTGKTTVARIVGELFYHLGILSSKQVKEVNRPDLVGQYKGHTAEKTKQVVTAAMGGVLFVDEAYQLKQSESDDFGMEAVQTLITELENHRSDFIAIFAGYTADMERFLDVNEGMRSRIPIKIEFPDYSPKEIGEIVKLGLTKQWNIGAYPIVERVAEVYRQIPTKEKANARWARNLVDEIVNNHKNWIFDNNPENLLCIHPDVLTSAIEGKFYKGE